MVRIFCFYYFLRILTFGSTPNRLLSIQEQNVQTWFMDYNQRIEALEKSYSVSSYKWNTNITDANRNTMNKAQTALQKFLDQSANYAKKRFNLSEIRNTTLRRGMNFILNAKSSLNQEDRQKLQAIESSMEGTYGTAKICPPKYLARPSCPESEKLDFYPDIKNIFQCSTNETVLKYVWKAWRDATGSKIRDKYVDNVKLLNKDANGLGKKDAGEIWRSNYEIDDPTFRENLKDLFREILPLYEEIHAYMRQRLTLPYGSSINLTSSIPAHLLGEAWAQEWTNLRKLALPDFHRSLNVTKMLRDKKYSVLDIFKVGLLPPEYKFDHNATIEYLMGIALDFFVSMPWTYLVDLWRWDVFEGKIPFETMNEGWWDLRKKYQGIHAPIPRTEQDLDPGSKYHIAGNVRYIRYFVARVLIFQFHEALCSVYGSKAAGNKFWEMLRVGQSVPWPETLKILTGTTKLSTKPVLRYFQPLYQWLLKENDRTGQCRGWGAKWANHYNLKTPRC